VTLVSSFSPPEEAVKIWQRFQHFWPMPPLSRARTTSESHQDCGCRWWTIHSAKGLDSFGDLAGVEEGMFPSQMSNERTGLKSKGTPLLLCGIPSNAKLYITYCRKFVGGFMDKRNTTPPRRFIKKSQSVIEEVRLRTTISRPVQKIVLLQRLAYCILSLRASKN